MKFDTVIKNGMVVDGSGGPRFKADVGLRNGIITEIGHLSEVNAKNAVDAEGLVVAPGFVDLHTHYDAQLFWDPYFLVAWNYHGRHRKLRFWVRPCGTRIQGKSNVEYDAG